MAFFNSAINILQTLVVTIGAGLGVWGVVNLMEGYGNDNPSAKSQRETITFKYIRPVHMNHLKKA